MKSKTKVLTIATLAGTVFLLAGCSSQSSESTTNTSSEQQTENLDSVVIQVEQNPDGSVTLPTDKVTEEAVFYEFTYNGVEMGAIAVEASDGSIRTALNTCQVCFDSGKGYYEQTSSGMLECQNCGNLFAPDDVEVVKGGCNPVPVDASGKTVNEDGSITISAEYLEANKELFSNWK